FTRPHRRFSLARAESSFPRAPRDSRQRESHPLYIRLSTTKIARPPTATSRRARPRWRRSPRVGGGRSADDNPSRRAGSPSWAAGLGRRVHPVGRSGGHIRACPHSLVASRITTGRAKRLPARFLRRRGTARLHTTH